MLHMNLLIFVLGQLYVNNIDVHITANYTNSTYKSCSQVRVCVRFVLF